jgi:glutamate carboxypeptidase
VDPWIEAGAQFIARRAPRELEALVAVSSPSGDVTGAEDCATVCRAFLPDGVEIERPACSSPGHAPDVIAHLRGTGTGRIVLVGHLDTVVSHADHQPLRAEGDHLVGSGSIDMKGGDVLALGVMRELAAVPERYAEAALLLVMDEEWRTSPFVHTERFAGWDACLCFEGGEPGPDGSEGVVVRRKAAGTLKVHATGRSSHSGSAPDQGRSALLALAHAAQIVSGCHDPAGPARLTAVPTVMRSGDAFNVVPGLGELVCDLRADDVDALLAVAGAVPAEIDEVAIETEMLRVWPGMDSRDATVEPLAAASDLLGRTITGMPRGGASDAAHLASVIPLTIDGLGPLGGLAHNPGEYVVASSLCGRAEVALAVTAAVLANAG